MEKITQKEFKRLLTEKQNCLIGVKSAKNKIENLEDIILNFDLTQIKQENFRTVKKVQTNALQFSNNSWLHFDNLAQEKSYYKLNNFIISLEIYKSEYTE
jgi:predicted methyltransferase